MEQFARLNKTRGYPDNRLAVSDYCNALKVMETFEGVRDLMDELVRTDWIHMPSASSIRGMAYDRMREVIQKRRACEICDGSGVQSIWVLVTYEGKSFSIKKSERIPVGSQGEADDFARRLQVFLADNPRADRQMVLSAAKECECRKRGAA
jgi:hypothetical protein